MSGYTIQSPIFLSLQMGNFVGKNNGGEGKDSKHRHCCC